jgi:CheY-like chemotaxis protein/HPt (histidine-containing phosphotransfer) domain-containing protein
LASLINDISTQSAMYIGEKPVRFILNISETLPAMLYGDDLRVKQVLNNILSNAFKFTMEGTVELNIECIQSNDTVWMTAVIRDTGVGIPEDQINSLFDDYVRMDTPGNRKIMGIGLGLPLAKKAVEMMDGTITVESDYGEGSTFTVRIPQGFVNGEPLSPEVVGNLKTAQYINEKRRSSKVKRTQLPYARILVVDDAEVNFKVVNGLMKPYGLYADFASSGQQAIDIIRGEKIRYNAVFMDHMMPEMDGIEATVKIRNEIGTDYAENIPIIAFTANAIRGNEEMFLSKGFQAFISKPVHVDRLDAIINRWVRDKQMDKWFEVDGVDIAGGIGYYSGDKDVYFDVLRTFADSVPSRLRMMLDTENLEKYAVFLHGMKGSLRGVGAEELGNRAEALEKAALSGDRSFVDAHNTLFIKAVRNLISEVNALFSQADEPR